MDLRSLVTLSVVALLGCSCVTTPSGHDAAVGRGNARFTDFQDMSFLSAKPTTRHIIQAGDMITFAFDDPAIQIDSIVKQNGTITLLSNQVFTAAGKTLRQLEAEVRDSYGFKILRIPPSCSLSYAVAGAVKSPNSYPYVGPTKVSTAIESAGGFTEFAKRTKVQLNREGHTFIINCTKASSDPKLDMEVIPDDEIVVPGSFWRW